MRQLSLPFPPQAGEIEVVFPDSVFHIECCSVVFRPKKAEWPKRDPYVFQSCNGFFVCPVCGVAFGWCVDADPITDPEEHPPYCMHKVRPEDLVKEEYGVEGDREETVN